MQAYRFYYAPHLIGTLFLFMMISAIKAQDNNELPVRKKLALSDFKGVADETVDYLAQTNPVVSLKYYGPVNCTENGKVKLKVETKISVSERSWMKISKIRNPDLLNALLSHEQGHYDLGEIFAIDLKRTLSASCFDKNSYKTQIDSVFRSMNARYDTLQRKYDTETGHMRNREVQYKWKQKIAEMLTDIRK